MRLNFAPFYADPKSCAAYREVRDEALTGELAGIPSPRVQEWENAEWIGGRGEFLHKWAQEAVCARMARWIEKYDRTVREKCST